MLRLPTWFLTRKNSRWLAHWLVGFVRLVTEGLDEPERENRNQRGYGSANEVGHSQIDLGQVATDQCTDRHEAPNQCSAGAVNATTNLVRNEGVIEAHQQNVPERYAETTDRYSGHEREDVWKKSFQ